MRSPVTQRPRKTAFGPWRSKNGSPTAMTRRRWCSSGPGAVSARRPSLRPIAKPTLSPRIAAAAATAMTASIDRCPRLATIAAVTSAVSPGTGMPIVSMATSRKTIGRPTFWATSTKVARGVITTSLLACPRCPP